MYETVPLSIGWDGVLYPGNIASKDAILRHTETHTNFHMKHKRLPEMEKKKGIPIRGNDDTLPACSSQPNAPELQNSLYKRTIKYQPVTYTNNLNLHIDKVGGSRPHGSCSPVRDPASEVF